MESKSFNGIGECRVGKRRICTVPDFSQETPSRAVTRQTEKKMVLKEIVFQYGVDGNGGLWYYFFALCYPRVVISWLVSVAWLRYRDFIPHVYYRSNKENPRLPAHGNGIPPVDDVTM